MNRVSLMLVGAMLFAVQPALASQDVQSELAEMRALVEGLKEKVEAQEEELSNQGELLEQAQDRIQQDDSKSGLSSFVDSLEVSGLVAGGWNWNFNKPDSVDGDGNEFVNSGDSELFVPFQGDHNQLFVDQVVFDVSKPATPESRAGFGFQLAFGRVASTLGQAASDNTETFADDNQNSTNDYYISEAYLEWLAPCNCGDINFTFGKFQTFVGSEVYQLDSNYNLSRGIVYSLLQPVDALGLTATSHLGPIELTLGLLSSGFSSHSSPDINTEKTYMASAAMGDDRLNGRLTYQYGAEGVEERDRTGLVDGVLNFNPSENLGMWANATYVYGEGSRASAWGVALAGQLGLADLGLPQTSIAVRGEYAEDQVSTTSGVDGFGIGGGDDRAKIWSVTTTVAQQVTESLKLAAEYRFDKVEEERFEEFSQGSATAGGGDDDQALVLLKAVYSF